jgi:hypothetical protein
VIPPTVTEIGPVVAPDGTVNISEVAEDEVTVALTPLTVTALLEGVALKPTPETWTLPPIVPDEGANDKTNTAPEATASMWATLPAASYEYVAAVPSSRTTAINRPFGSYANDVAKPGVEAMA